MGNSMKRCAGMVPEDEPHHSYRSNNRSHHSSYDHNHMTHTSAVNTAIMSAL